MKPMLVALKIAAIPTIAITYVAAMGLSGTCATCESMVDWTLGRTATAGAASGDGPGGGAAGASAVAAAAGSPREARSRADADSAGTSVDKDNLDETASEGGTPDPDLLGPVYRLDLPDLAGGSVPLSEYAGRPMLIEVWATWCGPCRRLRRVLTDAAPALAEQGTLVAVSVDQGGAAAVRNHLGDAATPFVELLATPEFRRVLAPHNPGRTIPKLVYVDSTGRVAGIELGIADPAWVEARLKALQ